MARNIQIVQNVPRAEKSSRRIGRPETCKIEVGKKYHRLLVLGYEYSIGYRKYYLCACDCGNTKTIFKNHIVRGSIKSCGCFAIEKLIKNSTTHGQASRGQKTPLYLRWEAMWNRCRHNGIYIEKNRVPVERWKSFANFADDMSASFEQHAEQYGLRQTTLDRIDNNERYSPENCRWATYKVQGNNR